MKNKNIDFAYFGTSEFAVYVIEELKSKNLIPKLVITTEDKPSGRKLKLSPSPMKVWAENNNIKYIQPKTLKGEDFQEQFKKYDINLSIVASYGKIIPKNIIEIPEFKTINVHPSLLPKLRGPSPIQNTILQENESGVTIIKIDEEVDHGPILLQKKVENIDWPPYADELEKTLGKIGGEMLFEVIEKLKNETIKEVEQDHKNATFTKKIEKADAELNFNDAPEVNLRKIRAYNIWPNAYYFENIKGVKKRIIIKKAHIENGELILERVVPEGKKEMNYKDFLRGV